VPYAFGSPLPAPLCGPWDFVLGSYILYDADCFPALARSLADLSGPATRILLTSHEPTREGVLRAELAKVGLSVHRVPFSLQDAQVAGHAADCHADGGAVPVVAQAEGANSRDDSAAVSAESSPSVQASEPLGLRSISILIVTKEAEEVGG